MNEQTIHCTECHFENPVGGKFCSNCGAKLPKSTKIICPRCQTPNPHDRLYCDNCGARLILETGSIEPEEDTTENASGLKAFTLPTRKPGDTGELDPDAVPDWLKTGQSSTLPSEDDLTIDSENLPRLEDLTPENRDTDDLPDWLVGSEQDDPIIHAPTIITTEHYQALLDREEREGKSPETADLLAQYGQDKTNLPDWLAATTSNQGAEIDSPAYEEAEDDNLDWLESLSQPSTEPQKQTPADEPQNIGVTEWLHSLDDETDTEDADISWLEGTTMLSEPAQETESKINWVSSLASEPPQDEASDSELEMDWLDELGPPQTNVLSEDQQITPEDDTLLAEEQLPDWMEELGPPQTNILAEKTFSEEEPQEPDTFDFDLDIENDPLVVLNQLPTTEDSDLPDWLANIDDAQQEETSPSATNEDEASWLSERNFPAGTSSLEWLGVTGELPPLEGTPKDAKEEIPYDKLDDSFMDTEPPVVSQSPDWLSELASLDTGELPVDFDKNLAEQEEAEVTAVSPADQFTLEFDELEADLPEIIGKPEPLQADDFQSVEDDTWLSTGSFLEEPLNSELPSWLTQLDEVSTSSEGEAEADNLIPSEDLPEWVTQLRPDEHGSKSGLTASLSELGFDGTLEDIPEDFAGAKLPDWLQDVAPSGANIAADDVADVAPADIPEWMTGGESDSDYLGGLDQATTAEWDSMLANLPPDEELVKAELPDWIQALKPTDAAKETTAESQQQQAETIGPLAGLAGVVGIEPLISRPRAVESVLSFSVTKEQQVQAALLQQLIRQESTAVSAAAEPEDTISIGWLRLVMGILLIGAVLVGLFGPNLLQLSVPTATPGVTAVHEQLTAQTGKPVLVVFDYTPAMSGELNDQALLILTDLLENNATILTMSQSVAGTMMALPTGLADQTQPIGFVPAESVGLRAVGSCLRGERPCDTVSGRSLSPEARQLLPDVSLVVVLTGDRDSLVNWVEQVASPYQVPMVAGITQALAPAAQPYLQTGQIDAALQGLPDTAVYQQTYHPELNNNLPEKWRAQTFASLLSMFVLILGAVIFGISGTIQRSKAR
ncbi:MAG: hypothetical protein Kow0080_14450 [Candidatus Promineifilaceae bacterium]